MPTDQFALVVHLTFHSDQKSKKKFQYLGDFMIINIITYYLGLLFHFFAEQMRYVIWDHLCKLFKKRTILDKDT